MLPGQLPQFGDDVVEEEVVAPVHHVDQEEHEREEHQGDAVHAVAPEFMRISIVVGNEVSQLSKRERANIPTIRASTSNQTFKISTTAMTKLGLP